LDLFLSSLFSWLQLPDEGKKDIPYSFFIFFEIFFERLVGAIALGIYKLSNMIYANKMRIKT